MKQVDGTALLVTIAEDLSNDPDLKVWALDKTEKKTGAPQCLSTLAVHNSRKQFPVRRLPQVYGVSVVLKVTDLCLCGPGRPFTTRSGLCERLSHSDQRGPDQ